MIAGLSETWIDEDDYNHYSVIGGFTAALLVDMKSSDLNDTSNGVSGCSLSPALSPRLCSSPGTRQGSKDHFVEPWGVHCLNECCFLHYTHTMSSSSSFPTLNVPHGPRRPPAILHDEGVETRVPRLPEVVIPVAVDCVDRERRCGTSGVRWTLVTICHCQTVRSTRRQRLAAECSASSALGGKLPMCAIDTRSGFKYLIRRVIIWGRQDVRTSEVSLSALNPQC